MAPFALNSGMQGKSSDSHHLCFSLKGLAIITLLIMFFFPSFVFGITTTTYYWSNLLDTGASIKTIEGFDENIFTGGSNLDPLGTYSNGIWNSIDSSTTILELAPFDGNLFTGHAEHRLGTYSNGIWTQIGGGAVDPTASMVACDGNLFTGIATLPSNGYVQTYKNGVWTTVKGSLSGSPDTMTFFDGNIFIGLSNGQLATYNSTTKVWTYLGDKGSGFNASIVFDGNLFTGQDDGNLGTYKNGFWTDLGDMGSAINALAKFDNNLFTGQENGHLGTYKNGIWTDLGATGAAINDLNANDVNLFTGHSDGNLGVYGPHQIGSSSTSFDVNLTKLDGYSFIDPMPQYAYAIDGNLTIEFDLYDSTNARHTISLYYSDQNSLTGGTAIVTDWNLNTGDCTNLNWNTTPVQCYWGWNIHRSLVPDGNYILRITASDLNVATNDLNEITPVDFNIANDVNLVIKRPIDESTGTIINYSKYSWTARITNSNGLQIYTGQIDENGFILPIGETTTIEIDTNTSDYFSRIYSKNYSSAQAFDELQPYLVTQATSENFVFSVINAATFQPIYNVEIQILGVIGGGSDIGLQTITTDSAGLATIPLRLNTDYTAKFYYNGTLVHTAYIRPTATNLFYQVKLSISGENIPVTSSGIIVTFSPTTTYILQNASGAVDINVSVSIINKTIQGIRMQAIDSNNCRYYDIHYDAPWVNGTTVNLQVDLNNPGGTHLYYGGACKINIGDAIIGSLRVVVDVNSTDGNQYQATSRTWTVLRENDYQWDIWYRLGITGTALNNGNGKFVTTLLATLIVFSTAGIGATLGGGDNFFASLVPLIILGLFVVMGWVDFIPFIFIAFGSIFTSMLLWRNY